MEPLQLISIQHELGMTIGLDLRLNAMLDEFTRACVRRLGLCGVDYYFYMDEDSVLMLPEPDRPGRLRHYLSLPRQTAEDTLPDMLREMERLESPEVMSEADGEAIQYYFRLPRIGFVVLRRLQGRIDPTVIDLLKPIMRRLTISCRASIEHQQLLNVNRALRRAEEQVTFQLYHDDLTQLPNRRGLAQRLEAEIAMARRDGHCGALLFLDLDRFKAINDSLGHVAGDHLLVRVAELLRSQVRPRDIVARLSGDEFVVVLPELGVDLEHAYHTADKLGRAFNTLFANPIKAGKHLLHVTPSIGVASFPQEGAGAEDVLRQADIAMYQAKSLGRNRTLRYAPTMAKEAGERLELEKALARALDQGELSLHFQPQMSRDGRLTGAEALLRWYPADQPPIPPSVFIPLAEETGLMMDLGKWVVQEACRSLRKLEEQGLPEGFERLAINVSPLQFEQTSFVEDLMLEVRRSGIDGRHFGLELTESTLIRQIDDNVAKMLALREHGIEVSIDDFGKGYSCLSYLNSLPIHVLKVDQAFVRNVDSDRGNRAIVETIMALGRSLDMGLIAEGIESREELDCLVDIGVERFQGYLFGRPAPFEDFASLIRARQDESTTLSC